MHKESVTRRVLLAQMSALGALALAEPVFSGATRIPPFRVDVHYHPMAPIWIGEQIVAKSMAREVIAKAKEWTPGRAIEEMDRNQMATAICSVANPGVWFGDAEQGRRLARNCNDYAARIRSDYPGRFGLFAALALPDVDGALKEVAYAFDILKADGIGLFTSYGDKWLADPTFAPVFEELNRRHAIVYVHPMAPSCCRQLIPNIPAALLEYPIDTSRTILQWILTKSTAKYPDVRFIFSHAGGLIMAGVGRLQLLSETQTGMRDVLPDSFPEEVAKFYYEISSSADAVTMAALRSYVPTSHILLGTDSPFIGSMAPNIAQLQTIGLSAKDLAAIERDNALALLKRAGLLGR